MTPDSPNLCRGAIEYVVGDATLPVGPGPKVLAHVCNDEGKWGKGFVVPLGRRWPHVREAFFAWHRGEGVGGEPFELGQVQIAPAEPGLWVANVIGQHGVLARNGIPPVRHDAIRQALERVAAFAREHAACVHMPRIGCGLSGGTWDEVGRIVEHTLCDSGVNVTVYDLPAAPNGAVKTVRR
jgi:O-acetyl-ADP-ribose deacetylase (regulator of RNase III)